MQEQYLSTEYYWFNCAGCVDYFDAAGQDFMANGVGREATAKHKDTHTSADWAYGFQQVEHGGMVSDPNGSRLLSYDTCEGRRRTGCFRAAGGMRQPGAGCAR